MRTDELNFDLPDGLIATMPAEPRDAARLLVVSRSDASRMEHRQVRDLPGLLAAGDDLVVNESRVSPAQFHGIIPETGGRFEGLFLAEHAGRGDGPGVWSVMLKARRHRAGRAMELLTLDGAPSGVVLRIVSRDPDEEAAWLVEVEVPPGGGWPLDAGGVLERVGRTPLPPYIRQARRRDGVEVEESVDRERYQTVYAGGAGSGEGEDGPIAGVWSGSVAAPTAGLHFTPGLLDRLSSMGVTRRGVTLHVGAGTFRPIESETLDQHRMHAEWCSLGSSAAALEARLAGRSGASRLIAVGTTSARTLESFAGVPEPRPRWLSTELFIQPGYRWRAVDGLLTNFHLPRSSLLAMVGSLFGADGLGRLLEIYGVAVGEGYRFYSYGDAMLILP